MIAVTRCGVNSTQSKEIRMLTMNFRPSTVLFVNLPSQSAHGSTTPIHCVRATHISIKIIILIKDIFCSHTIVLITVYYSRAYTSFHQNNFGFHDCCVKCILATKVQTTLVPSSKKGCIINQSSLLQDTTSNSRTIFPSQV